METESRPPAPDLNPGDPGSDDPSPEAWARALEEHPEAFAFFQAVRLLERQLSGERLIGEFAEPSQEALRFTVNSDLAFPAGDIQDLHLQAEGPARMSVNFMGLVGHMGVLPNYYSLLVDRQAEMEGDPEAYRDFLDIFQHRLVSLFYKAWERSHFYVSFERGEEDPIASCLSSLLGLGSGDLAQRVSLQGRLLLFYSGLLGMRQRSGVALEQLLEDFFGVPVEVEQFRGGWYGLSESSQCRIDDEEGLGGGLGEETVVGDEIWDPQARVRIRVGPLSRREYDEFLPGGPAYEAMGEITRFFSDGQVDFEVQLILDREEVPGVVLGSEERGPPPLGWCTWLSTKTPSDHADETILSI